VGTIPADWKCLPIGDSIDLLTGFPFPSSGYSNSGIRLLRGSNVKRGVTDWSESDVAYWPAVTVGIRKYLLKGGDIVIAMDGSLVGRSFAMLSDRDVPSLLLQRVARIRSESVDMKYLGAWICSSRFTEHCDAVKTVTAIPHISPADIRSFKVAFPPTNAEQRAVAEVLSDADALIESLEQLIAKKHLVKQGAMQELLTGKRRLLGFAATGYTSTDLGPVPIDWHVKRLDEVAEIDPDNLGSRTPADFAFNYISLEDVDRGRLHTYSNTVFASAPSRARRRLQAGDILVSTVRPNLQSHLLFNFDQGIWVCSTGFSVIRCKKTVAVPGFVYEHLFAPTITKQIESLLSGSNYPAINGRDVKGLRVPFPSTESEQIAIAAVLSDMDAETAALNAKLAKARLLRQGMAQTLLTGRIRLS
jgi:type I restriction enzyme S subunit